MEMFLIALLLIKSLVVFGAYWFLLGVLIMFCLEGSGLATGKIGVVGIWLWPFSVIYLVLLKCFERKPRPRTPDGESGMIITPFGCAFTSQRPPTKEQFEEGYEWEPYEPILIPGGYTHYPCELGAPDTTSLKWEGGEIHRDEDPVSINNEATRK